MAKIFMLINNEYHSFEDEEEYKKNMKSQECLVFNVFKSIDFNPETDVKH